MRSTLLGTLAVLALIEGGCATGGYQILQGSKAPSPSVGAGVVLYGMEGAGNPPPGCRILGTVKAWSFGEKTFPYDQFRAAAAELAGDSVVDIHEDGTSTTRRQPTFVGNVASCRTPPS